MLAINAVIVVVTTFLLHPDEPVPVEDAAFLLMVTLIATLYDRHRALRLATSPDHTHVAQ